MGQSRRGILECVHQELDDDDHHQVRTNSISLSLTIPLECNTCTCSYHIGNVDNEIINLTIIKISPRTAEVPWSTTAPPHSSRYRRLVHADKEENGTGRD